MLVSASYWGSQKSRRTLDFGMMWDKCCSGQSDCGCYDCASWTLIFLSIHFLPTVLRMLWYFPCSTLRWFSLVLFSHFYPCTILRSPGITLGISCDPKGVSWPIGLIHLLDQISSMVLFISCAWPSPLWAYTVFSQLPCLSLPFTHPFFSILFCSLLCSWPLPIYSICFTSVLFDSLHFYVRSWLYGLCAI